MKLGPFEIRRWRQTTTSAELIQACEDRYHELERKHYDWRSFFAGYLEGWEYGRKESTK